MRKVNLKDVKATPKVKFLKKSEQTQLKGGASCIIIDIPEGS
ncbi:MAG: hypothetical protein AAF990_16155 [Bacteroidota bacterium]